MHSTDSKLIKQSGNIDSTFEQTLERLGESNMPAETKTCREKERERVHGNFSLDSNFELVLRRDKSIPILRRLRASLKTRERRIEQRSNCRGGLPPQTFTDALPKSLRTLATPNILPFILINFYPKTFPWKRFLFRNIWNNRACYRKIYTLFRKKAR